MITYEIVDREYLPESDTWIFWLELKDDVTGETYSLSAPVASEDKADALQFLQDNLNELYEAAKRHGEKAEIFLRVSVRRLLFAMELANLDEFNRIRAWLGKPGITKQQAWEAIKEKLALLENEY